MSKITYLTLLGIISYLFPPFTIAEPSPFFKHREDTKTIVPAEIVIEKPSAITAHIGDNGLQSPILKLKINGQGPFLFLFDTGFSQSMISKRLAEKLNLPIVDSKSIKSITPNQVVDKFQHVYHVSSMNISDIVIKNYGMAGSSNFEDDAEFFEKQHIDGVLSANAFYPLMITIDYKKEKLYLEKGALNKDQIDTIPYAKVSDVPNINVKITFDKLEKKVSQNFILDTGFGSYFFVNSCNIPEMLNFTGKEDLLRYDYLGYENTKSFAKLFGNIEVTENHIIKSPYITFGTVNCELDNPFGLIGRKFFEAHKVIIDQKNSLVRIHHH